MREILELCVDLDRKAHDVYRQLSAASSDQQLATCFEQMAREEKVHVDWWSDLLLAWEAGLVPDIAGEHELLVRLREINEGMASTPVDQIAQMSSDDMLDLAVHLEFYMLDPVFGELTDLMQPGNQAEVREAYSRHVMRLVDAVQQRYTRPGLANLLAGVLTRAYRDQQRLSSLAMRDQLTGLLNRRGLLGHLNQWVSWSARYERPLGIALVDVDHFKQINDSLGHPVGDEALRVVARALMSSVRTSDVVGRFGGDEFLIIAPESDGEELQRLIGRLIEAVAAASFPQPVTLSLSGGGAWVPGGVQVSTEVLIARADESLYAAKAAGRNRASNVLLAEPAPAL